MTTPADSEFITPSRIGVSVVVTPLLAWVAQFASWDDEMRQRAIDALTARFCRWCGADTPCYCMSDD